MIYRITEEEYEAIRQAEKATTNKRVSQRLKVLYYPQFKPVSKSTHAL